jgi:hypothetical protein
MMFPFIKTRVNLYELTGGIPLSQLLKISSSLRCRKEWPQMDFPIHGTTAEREAIGYLHVGIEQFFGVAPSYRCTYGWPETLGLV